MRKAQDSGKKLTDWKKSSRKREWNLQLKDTKITCFFISSLCLSIIFPMLQFSCQSKLSLEFPSAVIK